MMGISEYGLLLEITGLDEIPPSAAPFFAHFIDFIWCHPHLLCNYTSFSLSGIISFWLVFFSIPRRRFILQVWKYPVSH